VRGSCRFLAATFAVVSSLTVSAVGQVAPQASPTSVDKGGAERLVFLLQYVGSDYAAAVQGGKLVDEAEYRENREFTAMIGPGPVSGALTGNCVFPVTASPTEVLDEFGCWFAVQP